MKKIALMLLALCLFVGCNQATTADQTATEANTETTAASGEKDREVFVDAQYVQDVIDGKKDVSDYVIAEVTWGEAKDSPDYMTKHIPGAIHINTDSVEEGPIWNLRSPEEIEKNFLQYGITKDTTLLLYGPDTGVDRVAFTALYMGVEHVKVLDGGLAAWEAAGFSTESGEVTATAKESFGVATPAHPEYVLGIDEVPDKLKDENFRLVSIRSEKEWLGIESGYNYIPKAGEPKGAIWGKSGEGNSDMSYYVDANGKNKPFSEIEAMWKEQGFTKDNDISFYCGTGWRATLPWLLAYEQGIDATLFDGGWNEWQMHDELEVQVGDPKSPDVVYTKVGDLPDDKASE